MRFRDLADQNLQWSHGPAFDQFDPDLVKLARSRVRVSRSRVAEDMLAARARGEGSVTTILGPRQVGKTTYLKEVVDALLLSQVDPTTVLYLSCDGLASQTSPELRRALDTFLQVNHGKLGGAMLLDEVTQVHGWTKEVKRLADQGVTVRFPLVVTGSSAHTVRRESEELPGRGLEGRTRVMRPLGFRRFVAAVAQHVAGRVESPQTQRAIANAAAAVHTGGARADHLEGLGAAVSDLAPFVREFQLLFDLYLRTGGYPAGVAAAAGPEADRGASMADACETLIRSARADASRAGRDDGIVRHLLRALLLREGQRVSLRGVAQEADTTHTTAGDYLSYLKGSYLVHVLEAWDPGSGRLRPRAERKVHFTDPLLRHAVESYVTGGAPDALASRLLEDEARLGRAVEGVVASHFIGAIEVPYRREPRAVVGHGYDKRGREVDLLMDGGKVAVEVKYQSDVRIGNAWRPTRAEHMVVLTREDLELGGDEEIIPACLALAALQESPAHL